MYINGKLTEVSMISNLNTYYNFESGEETVEGWSIESWLLGVLSKC